MKRGMETGKEHCKNKGSMGLRTRARMRKVRNKILPAKVRKAGGGVKNFSNQKKNPGGGVPGKKGGWSQEDREERKTVGGQDQLP